MDWTKGKTRVNENNCDVVLVNVSEIVFDSTMLSLIRESSSKHVVSLQLTFMVEVTII